MKATISVVTDEGAVFEGTVQLHAQTQKARTEPRVRLLDEGNKVSGSAALVFELEARPFMKRYGVGRSGPERLTLLVAHFAKGKVNVPVARTEVVRQWARMTAIMGGKYNGAYDTRARDMGWLLSPKAGLFELGNEWQKVCNAHG